MSDLPTVRIGKRTFTILFPDLLRPLSDGERAALKASVKKNGVQMPVVVDEDDGVVDGGNRLSVAAELGLTSVATQRTDRTGMTLDEKRELAYQLNDARRHLRPGERKVLKQQMEERRRRLPEVVADRAAGMTLAAIAEKHEVAVSQIQSDIKDAVLQGCKTDSPPPVLPDKVQGKDGKTYPARKPRKPKPAPAAPPAPPMPPPAPPPVEDDEPADTEADDHEDDAPTPGGLAELVAAWRAATWQAQQEFDAMRERGELD